MLKHVARPLGWLFEKLEANRPFGESDAWNLFRWSALAEACGWTLLIAGILTQHFHWPGASGAVLVTGQVHGTIFMIYFAVVLVTYGSLRWSRKKLVAALLCGVPPYGTLAFELWANHKRRNHLARIRYRNSFLVLLGA
ncbi:MAG TPA: DUF3817 domain-containing protein [Candidatus Saccharimonadales bacterium]|nr:DUF3817 domain-containing protein [Candidatus Saccharimonadales bacterium]